MTKIYEFSAKLSNGEQVNFSRYKGKVLLIVNTASKCGFTSQYDGLEKLYEKYSDQGLEILAFPCNQFGGQEPGSNEEIATFCKTSFGLKFPVFEKIDVNGPSAHPLFEYLRNNLSGFLTNNIKWNFTKFLITSSGKPYKRYSSTTKPESLKPEIEKLLNEVQS